MNLFKNKTKNDGSALIVALCVLAFLMALSAALLVSTQSVVNNNRKYVDAVQCKLLNRTMSETINSQIVSSVSGSLGLEIKESIEAKSDRTVNKIYSLSDNTTGAKHEISIFNTIRGTSNYELFVNVQTIYNEETYTQSSRFVNVKDESDYHWVLVSVENLTTGGSQE